MLHYLPTHKHLTLCLFGCACQSDKALSMGIEALSLDGGGSIDDLDLDFALPGYPDIELKV